MAYVYKKPNGRMVKVKPKEWNKDFQKRLSSFFGIHELYLLDDDTIRIEHVLNWKAKVTVILFFPVFFLLGLIQYGYKDAWDAILDVLYEKERGKFTSDYVYANSTDYPKLRKYFDA